MSSMKFRVQSTMSHLFESDHYNTIYNATSPLLFCLPNELLLHIFSYLRQEELITTVAYVCRRWHHLHTDPSLYRHLVFTENEPVIQVAVMMLKMAPWIKSLQISNRNDTNEILRHVAGDNRSLEKLSVFNCRGSSVMWEVSSTCLRDLFTHCPDIQHLSLEGTRCDSSLFYKEIGFRLPQLKIINMRYAWEYFSSDALLNIAKYCHHVEEIQIIDYYYFDYIISSAAVTVFCEKFKHTLKIVEFSYLTIWTDASVASLGRCYNIERVHLNLNEHITEEGLMAISEMPRLVTLSLAQARVISSDGWIRFFQKPFTKSLTHLWLYDCTNVDELSMRVIAVNARRLQMLSVRLCCVPKQFRVQIQTLLPAHCCIQIE